MPDGLNHPLQGMPPAQHPRLPMMAPVRDSEVEEKQQTNFYVEPFIGWRSWNIVVMDDKVLLRSITYKTIWTPGTEFVAHCKRNLGPYDSFEHNHDSPNKHHGCGIYAVKTEEDAARWLSFSPESRMRVMGEVKLWGIVYRYTRGFLSQYAYPKSIYVPHETPEQYPLEPREIVHELRKSYRGVEVRML